MDEPSRPSVAGLIEINRIETGVTGEPHGVLSQPLLESAWARPVDRWAHEDGSDRRELADAFVALIAHESGEPAIAELLRPHVVDYG